MRILAKMSQLSLVLLSGVLLKGQAPLSKVRRPEPRARATGDLCVYDRSKLPKEIVSFIGHRNTFMFKV